MTLAEYPDYNVSPKGFVTSTRNTTEPTRVGYQQDYETVQLTNDVGSIRVPTHRLVAECFLDNPTNLPVVNHIDGNKLNNCVTNLEWVSVRDNALHAVREGLYKKAYPKFESPFKQFKGKPVDQLVKGELVATFSSSAEAMRETGVDASSIKAVIKGVRASAGGYQWQYSEVVYAKPTKELIRMYRKVYHCLQTEPVDIEHLIKYIKDNYVSSKEV